MFNSDKTDLFDKEFRALTSQCIKTIHFKHGTMVNHGKNPDELTHLKRYMSLYEKSEPEKHFRYFETLFGKHRKSILHCLEDDRWLRRDNIYIQLGEGNRELVAKCEGITIDLSDIYLIACELKRDSENNIKDFSESFIDDSSKKNLIRPSIILLHLLRIFYHLTEGDDHDQLGVLVTQLETELQVKSKTVNKPSTSNNSNGETSGLKGIFDVAMNCMKSMGIEPPSNVKIPSDQDVINSIGSAFNNQQMQNLMSGVVDTFKNAEGLPDILESVTKMSAEGGIMDALKGAFNESLNIDPVPSNDKISNEVLEEANANVTTDESGAYNE
ncbi:MAG: hypothetical protein QM487_04210 [Candidatus Marithrix sp.]